MRACERARVHRPGKIRRSRRDLRRWGKGANADLRCSFANHIAKGLMRVCIDGARAARTHAKIAAFCAPRAPYRRTLDQPHTFSPGVQHRIEATPGLPCSRVTTVRCNI